MAATDEQSTAPEGRGADRVPWIVALLERNAPPLDDLDVVALAFKWATIELYAAYAPPRSRISKVSLRGPQVAAAALVAVLAPTRVAALGFTSAEVAGLIAAARPSDRLTDDDDDSAAAAWRWFAAWFSYWRKHRWVPAATVEGRRDPAAAVRFAVDEALASVIVSPRLAPKGRIEAALASAVRRADRLGRGDAMARREIVEDLKSYGAMPLVVEATSRPGRNGEKAPGWAKANDGRLVLNARVVAERLIADRSSPAEPAPDMDGKAEQRREVAPDDEADAADVRAAFAALEQRFGTAAVRVWHEVRTEGAPLTEAAARFGLTRKAARHALSKIDSAAPAALGRFGPGGRASA